MKEWVRNIYFLSTSQFSYSKMSKASNNYMAPQREDNKIVTQLRIINKQIEQMTNEFGDRLARLERQHFNDHGVVKLRLKLGEFNVIRVVRRVNTNMDEFVANNTNMSDVDFEDVSVGQGEFWTAAKLSVFRRKKW